MFEKYIFDPSSLNQNKPLGVSGLMRAKNEEKFLSLSIDSCIEALDELILCYQKSDDRTAEIAEEKRKQYPDKIKVFFYEPEIKSHKLSEEEFEELKKLPQGSVHLLANYYNYTLSKATYRYALKIDADQIYNSLKLKKICDLYRSEHKVNLFFLEKLTGYFFHFLYLFSLFINIKFKIKTYNLLPSSLYKKYISFAYKKIQNEKITSSLNGLNINFKEKRPIILNGSYENDSFPPFNGIFDHLIFEINQQTFYIPAYRKSKHSKYGNCIIEKFNWDNVVLKPQKFRISLVNLGFLWFHVAPMNYKKLNCENFFKFSDLNNKNQKKLISQIKKSCNINLYNLSRVWFIFFLKNWDKQSNQYLECWNQILIKLAKQKVNDK